MAESVGVSLCCLLSLSFSNRFPNTVFCASTGGGGLPYSNLLYIEITIYTKSYPYVEHANTKSTGHCSNNNKKSHHLTNNSHAGLTTAQRRFAVREGRDMRAASALLV